jgi:hypothetical protein
VELDGHVILDPYATQSDSFQVPINNPGLFGSNGSVQGLTTGAATLATVAGTGVLLNQTSGDPVNPFVKMLSGSTAAQPSNDDDDNDQSGTGGGREPEQWRTGGNDESSGGLVDYNSGELSKAAFDARKAAGITPGRNVATARVEGLDEIFTGFSKGGGFHAEDDIIAQLNARGIDPSRITQLYTERQPCEACEPMLDKIAPTQP